MNFFGTDIVFWIIFNVIIAVMLAFDLGVLSRRPHVVSTREAAIWSTVWIAVSMTFNWLVYSWFGQEKAFEFLAGYLIEKSLSVDNMFVFVLIFAYFNISPIWQARVLKWGIIAALVMRAVMIIAGSAALGAFHWMIYVFGGALIVIGARMMVERETHIEPGKNPILKLLQRIMPVTGDLQNEKFFVRLDGVRHATPLLLTLIVVETTDLLFAIDSIPAIFAITTNVFIVYTSNIFAILGLRALYFMLAGVVHRFGYLKLGLAIVLVFVGGKMMVSDFYNISIVISLAFVVGVLTIAIVVSWLSGRARAAEARS